MSVSAIVIAYYGDKWLEKCICSLKTASSERLHLILVDNHENTIIDELDLSHFETEIIRLPAPMGFAAANNYALVNSDYLRDYILFLNQDTISSRGWLDKIKENLEKTKNIGAISPVFRNYQNTEWEKDSYVFILKKHKEQLQSENIQDDKGLWYVNSIPATAITIRKNILLQIGPYDPIYGSYYEDVDLCHRIRCAGYKIAFCPSAIVRHYSGSSTTTISQINKRARQVVRNKVIYETRTRQGSRVLYLLNVLFRKLPYRFVRGIFGTETSQSPLIVLQVYYDIFNIIGRLLSSDRDEKIWNEYLIDIEWEKTK